MNYVAEPVIERVIPKAKLLYKFYKSYKRLSGDKEIVIVKDRKRRNPPKSYIR